MNEDVAVTAIDRAIIKHLRGGMDASETVALIRTICVDGSAPKTLKAGIRVVDQEEAPHDFVGADGFEDVRGALHVTEGSEVIAIFRRWTYAARIV